MNVIFPKLDVSHVEGLESLTLGRVACLDGWLTNFEDLPELELHMVKEFMAETCGEENKVCVFLLNFSFCEFSSCEFFYLFSNFPNSNP